MTATHPVHPSGSGDSPVRATTFLLSPHPSKLRVSRAAHSSRKKQVSLGASCFHHFTPVASHSVSMLWAQPVKTRQSTRPSVPWKRCDNGLIRARARARPCVGITDYTVFHHGNINGLARDTNSRRERAAGEAPSLASLQRPPSVQEAAEPPSFRGAFVLLQWRPPSCTSLPPIVHATTPNQARDAPPLPRRHVTDTPIARCCAGSWNFRTPRTGPTVLRRRQSCVTLASYNSSPSRTSVAGVGYRRGLGSNPGPDAPRAGCDA